MECDAEKLLHLIEERSPIYNFKLKDHSNRGVIDKLWEEIAKEMSLSVTECKSKWTSLRNSYNRAVRESRDNTASGSKGLKKRKWYLMDAMQFLNDFVGVHRKLGSNTEESPNEISLSDTQSEVDIPVAPEEAINQSDELPSQSASKKKKFAPVEKVIDPMIQFLKSRTKCSTETENPTLTFLKSLVPDIDKLTESRKRKLKQSVMNILYQSLEEQENFTCFTVSHAVSPSGSSSNAPQSSDGGTLYNTAEEIVYNYQ